MDGYKQARERQQEQKNGSYKFASESFAADDLSTLRPLMQQTGREEPRCAKCGYLLYNLRGTSCPECGEPIATPALNSR